MSLNERLKYLRKNYLKMTQNELGKSIGVTGFTISDIEKGKRVLTERNLSAICEKHNVNRDWLLTGSGEPIIEQNQDNKFINAVTKAANNNDILLQSIVTAYDSLSDEGKDFIYRFIKDIYNNITELEDNDNELATTKEPIIDQKIEEEVANYRQELLLEKNRMLLASQEQSDNLKNAGSA